MPDVDLSPEGVDRLRRSVAMLTPRHPGGLDLEPATTELEELERLQSRCGQLEHGQADVVADLGERVRELLR